MGGIPSNLSVLPGCTGAEGPGEAAECLLGCSPQSSASSPAQWDPRARAGWAAFRREALAGVYHSTFQGSQERCDFLSVLFCGFLSHTMTWESCQRVENAAKLCTLGMWHPPCALQNKPDRVALPTETSYISLMTRGRVEI
jgi:hypothetical protein